MACCINEFTLNGKSFTSLKTEIWVVILISFISVLRKKNPNLIKDLDVKGAGFTAKRGTLVKNIKLTENPEHIEGRVNGIGIVLVSKFMKKVQE